MGARRGRPAAVVELGGEERETLERWARRPKSSQALALRCRIVLAAAEGRYNNEIAAGLGCHPATVTKWRSQVRVSGASTGSATTRGRGRRARSPTPRSRR